MQRVLGGFLDMNKKVSVILPSLNVAAYIRECLDSVVNQSLRELEVICVDGGSVDGTAEVLKEYAGKDSRIVILNSSVKSYGRQVNMGLEYAKGEYVAILETDDWIAKDMYRCLYERAKTDRLDYASADFDTFIRLQSGFCYFARQYIFPDRKEGAHIPGRDWYGRVLGPDQIALLRSTDYVLWKGIYNREFLHANNIRLHESPGAAFQDMGFLQQVKSYAKRAEYIDKSFYRYRQGREEASSGCLEGLGYYEGEFRWLEGQGAFIHGLEGIHQKYYYFTMSVAFLTKYEQILSRIHGDWRDNRLSKPYEWFKELVSYAFDMGLLEEAMYGKEWWERLMLLLSSRDAHARLIADRDREIVKSVEELLHMIQNRPVVIFGCGKRGEKLMFFCDRNRIWIDAFCDNNEALHGDKKFGFPIISPMELAARANSKNEVILLSMKEGGREVRRQLTQMGIAADLVMDVPPGIL